MQTAHEHWSLQVFRVRNSFTPDLSARSSIPQKCSGRLSQVRMVQARGPGRSFLNREKDKNHLAIPRLIAEHLIAVTYNQPPNACHPEALLLREGSPAILPLDCCH